VLTTFQFRRSAGKANNMCNPASFVIVKEGRKFTALWGENLTESHEAIIDHFTLQEINVRGEPTLVRVEIIPPDFDFNKPPKEWVFRVDQDILPPWWDAKRGENCVRRQLKPWLESRTLEPGKHTVLGTFKLANSGSVVTACSGSVVWANSGSVVTACSGSKVINI
jgi:hypothetical protein